MTRHIDINCDMAESFGAYEIGNGLPCVLEDLGGFNGQVMGAAVHGGVPLLVEFLLGLDHAQRILRRGTGVQIDEGPAVDQLIQNGKVVPDPEDLGIIHRGKRTLQRGWRCYYGQWGLLGVP